MKNSAKNSPMKGKFILLAALVIAAAAAAMAVYLPRYKAEREGAGLPIAIDREKGEIVVPAEVNGKYFSSPTRHGMVFVGGSNGEKSVLRGLANETAFYQALLEIGAKAGENMTMQDMKAKTSKEGKAVQGDRLDVFLTWEGSNGEIPFAEAIRTEKPEDTRPMDIRFGGNLGNAKTFHTGCILCLDSCAVGIASNASYPSGTTQNDEVRFFGNDKVLPPDGTRVSVIFRRVP